MTNWQDVRRDCGFEGTGVDGAQTLATYLYHVVDNEWSMKSTGAQGSRLANRGVDSPSSHWNSSIPGGGPERGVLGPEAFDAVPFLDLLAHDYGSPWGQQELEV